MDAVKSCTNQTYLSDGHITKAHKRMNTFNPRNKGMNQQHTEMNWMQIRNLIVPIMLRRGHVCLACLLINLGTVSILVNINRYYIFQRLFYSPGTMVQT
jgi:hypothetical protein